jgi:hypothetical protein
MQGAGVTLPILVGLAYVNVSSIRVASNELAGAPDDVERYSITPNVIQYRDALMTEWLSTADIPLFFQDLRDLLWNAAGRAV